MRTTIYNKILSNSQLLLLSRMFTIKILPQIICFRQNVFSFHRHFRITSASFAKIFKEGENEFAHRVLESAGVQNLLKQHELIPFINKKFHPETSIDALLSKNWDECDISEIMSDLESIITYCKTFDVQISDKKFDKFIDTFADRRFELTDDQLLDALKLLKFLPETPSKHTRNYWDLWLAIEQVCLERYHHWDINKRLLTTDHFYQLNLGRSSKLSYDVAIRMGRKIPQLPKEQLLQLMFLLNVTRSAITEMIDIEVNLARSLHRMTIDEVAVVCMGFFKTETRIRDPIVLKLIYEKLKANLDTIESIPLVNIFKVLRHSSKNRDHFLITGLLDAIVPHLSRFSLMACLHVALLGTDLQQCHEKSLSIIVHRFVNEIDKARLKDIERISFIIGLYDFKTPEKLEHKLCQLILRELETRIDEIALYPRALSQTLSYLALIDPCYCSPEMISTCLNPEFLLAAYGKNYYKYGRDILFLDSFAEIFYGDTYKGNRMIKRVKDYLSNISIDYLPNPEKREKMTFSNRILLEVFEACEEVYGKSRMYHPLPHFQRPDVILAINTETGDAIDISHNYPQKMSSLILTSDLLLEGVRDREKVKLFALVVGGWNQLIRGTGCPTGLLKNKILQLRKCGYEPIMFDWEHWPKMPKAQRIYLRQKIQNLL